MSRTNMRLLLGGAVVASVLGVCHTASAITREETLVRARSYAGHKWSSGAANTTATCSAAYQSLYIPGDYVGVAYDWGGYMGLATFDSLIAQGQGAGSQEPDGILSCTAGVDCSGFVSMAWSVGHFTTSSMAQTSAQIAQASMLPADIFNKAGFHVAMQAATKANGEPLFIEALGYNVNVNSTGGLSHVAGYLPRRLNGIVDSPVTDPVGTTTKPILIGSFPYTDSRSTAASPSSVLDACAAAPSTQQKGPEVVYLAKITTPGTLTVTVSDDASSDIDVQILAGNPSPSRCIGRNDSTVSMTVGCGDYYIVADTFGANAANAGNYTLNATLTPSGQACAAVAGPPAFNPKGKLGDKCAFPGNKNLPFCNANLGGETCIYSQTESFCSVPCAADNDCGGLQGGCCRDLGQGEKYCLTQAFCAGGTSSGVQPGAKPKPGDGSGTGEEGTGVGTGEGDPGDDPNADPAAEAAAAEAAAKSDSGCSTSPGSASGWSFAPVAAAVLALASRKRRRAAR